VTLDGKTIVVTGTGAGLGRAVASHVLRDGGNAVLAARKDAALEELAQRLDPSGERVASRVTDIGDVHQCRELAGFAADRFGTVDGVVQIAAQEVMGGLGRTTDDDWRSVLDTNVIGTVHVMSAITEVMNGAGGSIVLIGSQTFRVSNGAMQQAAYAASKGALHSAMFHAAWELGPRRIRVNMVVPSWMWGPAVQQFVRASAERRGVDEEVVTAPIRQAMPLGEIPTVEDVAEAVVFLSSDRARMITGQTLFVNAGNHMT
jgi:NAD(P)-dependent dehydrogenase (short-subunit alcohol dehydrogenase family)